MKVPVQRYYIGRCVMVWRSDERGSKCVLLIEEGFLRSRRIEQGKELRVEVLNATPICFGAIESASDYKRHSSVRVLVSGQWYILECNKNLEALLQDHIGWTELWD